MIQIGQNRIENGLFQSVDKVNALIIGVSIYIESEKEIILLHINQ
jgi:hypothetical protein